jgi:hypothetical protein
MNRLPQTLQAPLLLLLTAIIPLAAQTIYITNDACSDYTWGFDEAKTRRAYADVVRAHLDEMLRTDSEKPENQDRYNLSITQEAQAFVEFYPERKQELIRRIQEGRVGLGPVYNNALWGFQSAEAVIRTLYPARRLERDWKVPLGPVQHIEEPALPWGVASILAASGFRWLTVAYLDFDSTFAALKNPPLFLWEGPDDQTMHVVMDNFASKKANYVQGAYLLKDPSKIDAEWLPHYRDDAVSAILASGTHGDNNPSNGNRAAGFAEAIIRYNGQPEPHAKLINATLQMFASAIEAAHPQLPTLRGDFGQSWDLWPLTLAKYAADERTGEHALLAAEALMTRALAMNPAAIDSTRDQREKAEWNWIMLADHAWNGSDAANRTVNAELRRKWSEELQRLARDLMQRSWNVAGLVDKPDSVTVFNSLSAPRTDLAAVDASQRAPKDMPSQAVTEDGRQMLYWVSPRIDGYGFATFQLTPEPRTPRTTLQATAAELDSPFYHLRVDPNSGGLASLVYKPTGKELLVQGSEYTIGQTVFFDGKHHTLTNIRSEVEAIGPVLARLKITGSTEGIDVVSHVTIYAALDRVDFDIRIHKPVSEQEQRLMHMFPVVAPEAVERIQTVGAVERPASDLLPGADPKRFAIQGFVDASAPTGPGVTVAPVEAFALRRDLGSFAFEALGNDMNYKEAAHDQHGVTDFRFRYSLRAHRGAYKNADTEAWCRAIATPLTLVLGSLKRNPPPTIAFDPQRATALAFKPAEERGQILRIQETAGRSGAIEIRVPGYKQAVLTDLLERDLKKLEIRDGHVTVDLRANGYAAIRLLP